MPLLLLILKSFFKEAEEHGESYERYVMGAAKPCFAVVLLVALTCVGRISSSAR